MFKILRSLAPSRQPVFRPSRSLLRHNGQINIQRVRFVRPFFTRSRVHRFFLTATFIGSVFGLLVNLPDEEEQPRDTRSTVESITQEGRERSSKLAKRFKKGSGEEDAKSTVARREGFANNGRGNDPEMGEVSNSILENREDREEEEEKEEEEEEDEEDEQKQEGEEDNDEDDEEDDEFEEEEEEDEEDDEEPQPIPENALFIPLGFARQRRASYYKGSGPEWQSFMEFSRDEKRNDFIKYELTRLVGSHTANLRGFQKMLGIPIVPTSYWLNVDFPDRPPPVYERRGLEITSDYIALTTRPVSAWQYSRLKLMLWPVPMAESLWASYKTLWSLHWVKVKDYLKVRSEQGKMKPNPSTSFFDFRWLANHRQESQPDPGGNESSGPESSKSSSVGDRSKSSTQRISSNVTGALPLLPTLLEPGKDMRIAFRTFRRTLARNSRGPSIPQEPGTFRVTGIIEMVGPRAVCQLEVQAFYHPRESRYISIAVAVIRVQERKQSPKRP